MENKLTVKQKYQLHKEYKGVSRVVVYKGADETTWDIISPNDLCIGNVKEGLITLSTFLEDTKKEHKRLQGEIDLIKAENKKLHETIRLLLQVKGE